MNTSICIIKTWQADPLCVTQNFCPQYVVKIATDSTMYLSSASLYSVLADLLPLSLLIDNKFPFLSLDRAVELPGSVSDWSMLTIQFSKYKTHL